MSRSKKMRPIPTSLPGMGNIKPAKTAPISATPAEQKGAPEKEKPQEVKTPEAAEPAVKEEETEHLRKHNAGRRC